MCKVKHIWDGCGHTESKFHECDYFKKGRQEVAAKKPLRRFFSLRRHFLFPETCPAPKGIVTMFGMCKKCQEKAESSHQADQQRLNEGTQQVHDGYRRSLVEQQQQAGDRRVHWDDNGGPQSDALGGLREPKATPAQQFPGYLCSECLQKKRYPNRSQRDANMGYCCPKGVREASMEETLGLYLCTDCVKQNKYPSESQRDANLGYCCRKGVLEASGEASQGFCCSGGFLQSLGLDAAHTSCTSQYFRDRPDVDEELVRELRRLSGFRHLTRHSMSSQHIVEQDINWVVWEPPAVRTNHGSIPPPPNRPLPPIPQSRPAGSTSSQGSSQPTLDRGKSVQRTSQLDVPRLPALPPQREETNPVTWNSLNRSGAIRRKPVQSHQASSSSASASSSRAPANVNVGGSTGQQHRPFSFQSDDYPTSSTFTASSIKKKPVPAQQASSYLAYAPSSRPQPNKTESQASGYLAFTPSSRPQPNEAIRRKPVPTQQASGYLAYAPSSRSQPHETESQASGYLAYTPRPQPNETGSHASSSTRSGTMRRKPVPGQQASSSSAAIPTDRSQANDMSGGSSSAGKRPVNTELERYPSTSFRGALQRKRTYKSKFQEDMSGSPGPSGESHRFPSSMLDTPSRELEIQSEVRGPITPPPSMSRGRQPQRQQQPAPSRGDSISPVSMLSERSPPSVSRGRQPQRQPPSRADSISPVSVSNERWDRVLRPTQSSSSRSHQQQQQQQQTSATRTLREVASRLDARTDEVIDAWTAAKTRDEMKGQQQRKR